MGEQFILNSKHLRDFFFHFSHTQGHKQNETKCLITPQRILQINSLQLGKTNSAANERNNKVMVNTMYKRVADKIRPVRTTLPEEARTKFNLPDNLLDDINPLPTHPPEFIPGERLGYEELKQFKRFSFLLIILLLTS